MNFVNFCLKFSTTQSDSKYFSVLLTLHSPKIIGPAEIKLNFWTFKVNEPIISKTALFTARLS